MQTLLVVEWVERRNQFALQHMPRNGGIRWAIYYILILAVILMGGQQTNFSYFQF